MMCELCELTISKHKFIITTCVSCNVPMVVSREHKPEFTDAEKAEIQSYFPSRNIRWEMRSEKRHAHCHIGG